jgi:hypothetical protein
MLAGIVFDAHAADKAGTLMAGTAKADITYAVGTVRGAKTIAAEDIKGRLCARVVVLQDQAESVAIVSADMIFFPSARVVREAREKWKVNHVILCGTHTHSGGYPAGGCTKIHPEGTANPQWTRMGDPAEILNLEFPEDPWYRETEDKVIAAIGEAKRNLFPARIAAARGPFESAYMAHNRRTVKENGKVEMLWANPERIPTKPVDPTIGVIRIDDLSGRPRALLVNYACHAVTLTGTGFISPDFPGEMCDYVEQELGDQCMAMFLQGAQGDMDPFEMSLPGKHALHIARQAGISLGKGALRVARDLKSEQTADSGSLKMKESILALGHRNDPTKTSKVGILTVVINNDIALVTIPGEPFIQHQLDLRAKSPLAQTFLLGLAYAGAGTPFAIYIPTAQAVKEGGYGATEASFVEAGAGEKMVNAGIASIKELKTQQPRPTQ